MPDVLSAQLPQRSISREGLIVAAQIIICPTDFSPSSEAGLRYATSLARDSNAKLIIIHVDDSPLAYGGGESAYGVGSAPGHPELAKLLAEVAPTDPTVECEHRLVAGDPAREIVSLAKETEADMIVMATHGRTGLTRLLMGSVAEVVVRRAGCPVLTVKQPQNSTIDAS